VVLKGGLGDGVVWEQATAKATAEISEKRVKESDVSSTSQLSSLVAAAQAHKRTSNQLWLLSCFAFWFLVRARR
jgi:hypothetical protein